MTKVLLITVNFNTPGSVLDFCKAARAQAPASELMIAVVDNSSCFSKPENASSAAVLAGLDVVVCEPGENLGYFGGAKFAYQALGDNAPQPAWVIVANSDIAFLTDDFFSRLRSLTVDDDVMAVGPDIVRLPEGEDPERARFRENPMRISRPSSREMKLRICVLRSRTLTALAYLRAALRRKYGASQAAEPPARRNVYMIHGSFMILCRNYFSKTAGLSFPGFLFGEEIFVAEEVRRAGGTVMLEPSLRLAHVGGNSTTLIPSDRRRRFELASVGRLYEKYFSEKSDT